MPSSSLWRTPSRPTSSAPIWTGPTPSRQAATTDWPTRKPEVLGQYLPVPCVIVRAEAGPADIPTAPVLLAEVSITVRDSIEAVTLDTHQAYAVAVSDLIWDTAALAAAIQANPVLTLSGFNYMDEKFERTGRAFETTFALTVCISSKSTV